MESITLNGKKFYPNNLDEIAAHLTYLSEEFNRDILQFLAEWWNNETVIEVMTSGSTGTPKNISLDKRTVKQSAIKTIHFFNLHPNDCALLCLPVKYISGKLMLVRAIEGQLNLIIQEPDSNPFANIADTSFDFAAVIPMQAQNALKQEFTANKIRRVRSLLIGGGNLTPFLTDALEQFANSVYLSFGMTETATHVALKQVAGKQPDNFFTALNGVNFSIDHRECLVIEADHLKEKIITNDLVKLISSAQFEWIGRWDNIINSGGIKHVPEAIEKALEATMEYPFFITGVPDDELEQRVVLVVESEPWTKERFEEWKTQASKLLNHYQLPKDVIYCNEFVKSNSKIDRTATLKAHFS